MEKNEQELRIYLRKRIDEYCRGKLCNDCDVRETCYSGCPLDFELPTSKLQEIYCAMYPEMRPKSFDDQRAKADEGKAPISLVPMEIVWAIAWIRKYGNEKYGDPDNWKTVEPERYRDALMRHILHYISDPKSVDEESGYPHLWHAACNMAFLLSMDYGDRVYSGDTFEALRWKEIGKALNQGFKEGLTNEETGDARIGS